MRNAGLEEVQAGIKIAGRNKIFEDVEQQDREFGASLPTLNW